MMNWQTKWGVKDTFGLVNSSVRKHTADQWKAWNMVCTAGTSLQEQQEYFMDLRQIRLWTDYLFALYWE